MEFIPNKIMQELGALEAITHYTLMMAAYKGCALRELRKLNRPASVASAGNDLHAQVAIGIVDRLESLIRDEGKTLSVSLQQLASEGWAKRYEITKTGSN